MAVTALATLWSPTSNYLNFYIAIEKLSIRAACSSLEFEENYKATITINITVENPTQYSGIGIVSIIFDLLFIKDNVSTELAKMRLWFKEEPGEPLGPHSKVSKSYPYKVNMENMKEVADVIMEMQRRGEKIPLYLADVSLDISTFVGRTLLNVEDVPCDP
ncbi:MAG: hypothetical protein QW146_06100 [Candidatus Bathyarchaeia archaeon]